MEAGQIDLPTAYQHQSANTFLTVLDCILMDVDPWNLLERPVCGITRCWVDCREGMELGNISWVNVI